MKHLYRAPFLFLSFFGSFYVVAQESQSPGEIITDRPDETEAPSLVPKGYLQIETGAFFEKREEENLQSRLTTYNTTLLRYGLLENLEIRIGADLIRFEEDLPGLGTKEYDTGLEPLLLGVKIGIAEEKGILPQIGFLGHLHLPFAAAKDYKPETTGVDFRFAFTHTLTTRSDLSYNLGAKWVNDNAEVSYIYTLAYGYGITDALGLYAELYGDLPEAGKAEHQWDAGATYLLAKNFQLDAFVGSGIKGPQQLWVGGGLSIRLPN